MNILYLSVHEILEYDELKLFTEMGHKVFSLGGAFQNPQNPGLLRPTIKGLHFDDKLLSAGLQSSKDNIHDVLIEWADVIMVMHRVDWIRSNWQRIKHKRVIWRSIGQSIPDIELQLHDFPGLQLVRYSPAEQRIREYAGHTAIIRFYKDPDEFGGWRGEIPRVMTIAQHMPHEGRRRELNYKAFKVGVTDLPAKVFGPGNEEAGELNGGQISYDQMKSELKQNRVYFYTGTMPASYTLGFIEAWMTGIPVVAIGKGLAYDGFYKQDTYEVEDLIQNNKNGYVSDNIEDLQKKLKALLENQEIARQLGIAGRNKSVTLFGKQTIMNQWRNFL